MGLNAHATAFAPPRVTEGPSAIIGWDHETLADWLAGHGVAKFRAKQLWQWVYQKGVTDPALMTNLAKTFRAQLTDLIDLSRPELARVQESTDGTRKWLLRMADGQEVEAVFIPEEDRGTLCVSSQVGCTLTCRFCHTGTQGLVRNLGPAEIVSQIMVARDQLADWPSGRDDRRLTNIVMMGMGEPLYNYDNVAAALKIVMDPDGIAISKRRITLSTAGVAPMIERCGRELDVNLAISLHAVTDELRDRLVPLNKKYPIAELMAACRSYPSLSNARRITFEYVMLKGVNDTDADARELIRLLRGIPAKINLIPFNPWPGAPFECSAPKAITRFGDIVTQAGYPAPVRTPRGRDILAACGQLRSDSRRQRKNLSSPEAEAAASG